MKVTGYNKMLYFFPSLPFWPEGPKRQVQCRFVLAQKGIATLQGLGFVRGKFLQGTSKNDRTCRSVCLSASARHGNAPS